MIGGDSWFKLFPLAILMALDYQRLSDAELGFLIRCQCYIALHGWLPNDPDELGKVFGIRPSSAKKKLTAILRFFLEIRELPPKFRELLREIHGGCEIDPKNLTMPSFLRENAEFLLACKQARSGGKSTRKSKPNLNPDGLDWDEIEEDRDQDRDRDQTNTSPSGRGTEEEVEFVRPASPAKPIRSTPVIPVTAIDLDSVLGAHKHTWQQLVNLFGSGNVKPVDDAPTVAGLLNTSKVSAEDLLKSVRTLRSQRSSARFMGRLSDFLDSGSYLVCSDPDSHTPSMAPAHRQKAEEAASDQWSKYLNSTGTQPTPTTHPENPHGTEP